MTEVLTLVVDLDGTLCEQVEPNPRELADSPNTNYFDAMPRENVIAMVNAYHARGWRVVIFTARGMNTFWGQVKDCEFYYRDGTEKWLQRHGVKYHTLQFGKPSGDIYVDDKGANVDEFLKSSPG